MGGCSKPASRQYSTIEDNLLVTQEIDQREEKLLLLGGAGIVGVQSDHHLGAGLFRMGAVGLVRGDLVDGAAPLAPNAGKLAVGRPLLALIALVVLNGLVRELIAAVLALTGQLRHGLLDGQVARRVVLVDLGATVRTGRVLVAQSGRVRKRVSGGIST